MSLHLYRVRVRARLVQELFAVVGIAAGVALLFASQVASQSLSSSVAQLSTGSRAGELQLLARDPHGMPRRTARAGSRDRRRKGRGAVARSEREGERPEGDRLGGARRSRLEPRQFGGALVSNTELEPFAGIGAVLLPAPLATHLGVTKFGSEVTLKLYGRTEHAPLYEQLHARQIGGLVASPIVVAPLFYGQELAGLTGRVSRILVEPVPGAEGQVRVALERLAAGRLNVEPTSYDERLFAKAAAASNQSTALFAVISALVGFLFAFNAMLLTVPQRQAADRRSAPRRICAEDRHRGSAARRDRAGSGRMRAGPGAWARSSRSICSAQTLVISARPLRWARSGGRLAERRGRRRRRDAGGDRRGAEPVERHPLPGSACGDHPEGGLVGWPGEWQARSRWGNVSSGRRRRSCLARPGWRSSAWCC